MSLPKVWQPSLRVGAYGLRLQWIPLIVTLLMVGVTGSLGRWQLHRAQEKDAVRAQIEQRQKAPMLELTGPTIDIEAIRYRMLRVRGTYLSESQILIDNRSHRAMAGYHVITPLRLRGGAVVLINRGWTPRRADYPRVPAVTTPSGEQVVDGVAIEPAKRPFELSSQAVEGRVWQNLTIARFEEQSKLKVLPFVLLQRGETGDGLQRVPEMAELGADRHRGYAFQWFALCATLLVIYAARNIKKFQ